MCNHCWETEYGSPDMDSGTIRRAVKLIRDVYDAPNGGAGGGLHVVVDDWNLGDEHLACAIDNADLTDVEDACARHLLSMTEKERASALARYDEYVT